MVSPRILALCVLAPAVAGACVGLKTGTDININVNQDAAAPSGSGETTTGDDDDSARTVPAPPDAGPAPDDFSCEKNYWVLDNKPRAECAARRVAVITTTPSFKNNGVSIARTTTGRIGISFNYDPGPESSSLRIAHFTPTTPDFGPPVIVTRAGTDYEHIGSLSRLAASAPDTFHVLSFDYDAASDVGTVNTQKLVDGTEPLTPIEQVAAGVTAPAEIGYALDSSKTAYALVRMSAPEDRAKLLAFQKPNDGAWGSLPNIPNLGFGLLPALAPASGASSLVVDANDRLHVLFHHNETQLHSSPRYHLLSSGDWTYRKTIDNNAPDGFCGFSPRLAVFGPRKYALYYYNRAGEATPSKDAELRLSTWVNEDDEPTHEVINQQIPSTTPMAPRYAAAMAVDKYGLVHLALVRPSPNESHGYLEYRRQQRVVGGGTRWVSDIIDDDVLSVSSGAHVDMLVDENARPHIAYISGKDLALHYATRYDR